jgi:excisionase family DNA binding protein
MKTQTPAICLRIPQVVAATGLCRAMIYRAIQKGALPIRKVGRATLITCDDLNAWLASMPVAPGKAPTTSSKKEGQP